MFFSKLPNNVKDAIHGLVTDQVFQDRFGHDPVLDELDDEKNSFKETFSDLLATLNFKVRYKGKLYNNMTPIKWCYLWCLENSLVRGTKDKVPQADIDLFFYILENEVKDVDVKDLLAASFNYCKKQRHHY